MIIEFLSCCIIGAECTVMAISTFPLLWPMLCCELCCFPVFDIIILLPLVALLAIKWFIVYPAICLTVAFVAFVCMVVVFVALICMIIACTIIACVPIVCLSAIFLPIIIVTLLFVSLVAILAFYWIGASARSWLQGFVVRRQTTG